MPGREPTPEEIAAVFDRVGEMVPSLELMDGDVVVVDGRERIVTGAEWGYVQTGTSKFPRSLYPKVEYVGRCTNIPQRPGRPIILFTDDDAGLFGGDPDWTPGDEY